MDENYCWEKIREFQNKIEDLERTIAHNQQILDDLESMCGIIGEHKQYSENYFQERLYQYNNLSKVSSKKIIGISEELNAQAIEDGNLSIELYKKIQQKLREKAQKLEDENLDIKSKISLCEDNINYYFKQMDILDSK